MIIHFETAGRSYQVDLSQGIDLSSTLGKPREELKAWGVPDVKVEPVKQNGWVGRVSEGAPINFNDIAFNPHGNGTHTECYGHISADFHGMADRLKKHHFVCELFRMTPEDREGDKVVTLESFKLKNCSDGVEAVILLAGDQRPGFDFTGRNPVYFEPGLMDFLRRRGVQHFLTNLPSVDPEEDGGALLSHRAFWNYPQQPREAATITELLLVPDEVPEGRYLLNLQLAAFENDAVPSRPVIYPMK